ncbi:DUF3667 domain-containing protein [Frateuria sp.]|uniref:DUF3667 domain-containing protein n=1 Tax=Frateuria sp. TaxID=2211372 RepID=UPI001810EF71|nr:DUF3667 domain-containing protein [Frateuria sp.]NUR22716.1 DUF3667 domain-containing protein [Frateuria sp.]
MNELTEAGAVHCANCATPLEGEFCHHCGQSVHSVLKPVHHMLEDGMDMFLHVDGRIVHTLPPLLLKPGFLTLEYFGGRRQRYVAPFRLMFVLCLLAFFAFHLMVDMGVDRAQANTDKAELAVHKDTFAGDDVPAEVRGDLKDRLHGLDVARRTMPASLAPTLDANERALRAQANERLAALGAAPLPADFARAVPAGSSSAAPPKQGLPGVDHAGQAHSKLTSPKVHLSWLPDFMNSRLTAFVTHLEANLKEGLGNDDPQKKHEAIGRMITSVFSLLPQAMVVMIPIFALMLKLFYVFRRRLYMEHLIVALHSHAFLFLALLLTGLLGLLSVWLQPRAAWAASSVGLVGQVLALWMPAYLLIMQKRIYRQGWPMTLLKYWCVGWCYFWLMLVVLGVVVVLGAAH